MARQFCVVALLALIVLSPTASTQSVHPRILETIIVGEGEAVALNVNNQVVMVQGQRSFLWSEGSNLLDIGGFATDVPQTRAYDLSDRGHVVGRTLSSFGFLHPFVWTLETGMSDVDPDITAESSAWTVNAAGDIAGGYGPAPGVYGTAFRRNAESALIRRNPLGGACGGAAYDINMFGTAVGESSLPSSCAEPYHYHPFTWTADDVARDLGTLGGADGRAVRINSLTQVTGESTTASGASHAFIWSERHGIKDLGTLGGASSSARAINEFGHVVGTSVDAAGQHRAFLWRPFEGLLDLGPGEAVAINEFDHVVGTTIAGGVASAFAWTPSDGRFELPGGVRAVAVNNNGWILGEAQATGGPRRAVIWRMTVNDADGIAYRYGLIDAHVAFGTLEGQQAKALRAQLRQAERALHAGRDAVAERALLRFSRRLAAWAPEELPWQ